MKTKAKPAKEISVSGQHSTMMKPRGRGRPPGSKSTLKTPKKRKYSESFLEAILYKHDIDYALVRRSPQITPILAEAEGGLQAVVDAMRFSADPDIIKFLRLYDATTDTDRDCVPWEAWAIKAGLDIHGLLGSILIAIRQHSVNLVKVLAITGHPATTRARIKNALTPRGYKDRDALDVALGFAPQAKGTTFIGKIFAGTAQQEEEKPPSRPDEPDVDDLFPDLSETQFLITDGK